MQTKLAAADFWELRARATEANAEIRALKARAQMVEAARDAFVGGVAQRYGFDPMRPFVLDDADLTLSQEVSTE